MPMVTTGLSTANAVHVEFDLRLAQQLINHV